MLCDGCHENEAVVFYTEIINGEKKELHLCEACAAKETGMDQSFVSLTVHHFWRIYWQVSLVSTRRQMMKRI